MLYALQYTGEQEAVLKPISVVMKTVDGVEKKMEAIAQEIDGIEKVCCPD